MDKEKQCKDCKWLQELEYDGQKDGMCHYYGDFISLDAKYCENWQQKYEVVID